MSKPLCLIQAPFFTRSGYGDWANTVGKSIIRYDKFEVKIVPTRWGNCQTKRHIDQLDIEDQVLASKILQGNLDKQPDLYIQITIPNEFQKVGKYNIGMTAGIETTICSGEWLEGLNRMDLNIGLSNHVKKVFNETKMTKQFPDGRKQDIENKKPIEVCFWGADTTKYFKTDIIPQTVNDALAGIEEKFVFLFVGQWTHEGLYNDRKDIGNLVKTFLNAFKTANLNNRPCLIIKTSGTNFSVTDRYEMTKKIALIKKEVGGENLPNVYLLHGELTDEEMNGLFNHRKVKCHISFTHGEGFGHPLLLSTLSGKPLLVSEWSGHLDYLNPTYSTYLPGNLVQVDKKSANDWILKESKWFKVSYSLAEERMKTMFNHYNENVLKKAENLRKENAEKFSMTAMDKKLWSILDKYVPEFAVENKFVLPKLKKIDVNTTESVQPTSAKISLPKLKIL